MLDSVSEWQMVPVSFDVGDHRVTMSMVRDTVGAQWSSDHTASRVLAVAEACGHGDLAGQPAFMRFMDEYLTRATPAATVRTSRPSGYKVPKQRGLVGGSGL